MEPVAVPRGKGLLVDADVRAIIPAGGGGGGGGSGGDMERMLTVMLILMVVMKLFIF